VYSHISETLTRRKHTQQAKQYLLHRNAKAAKREIKSAMHNTSPLVPPSCPLLLKSHLEYLRGNFKKSHKLLSSVSDPASAAIQLNNMGCLQYRAHKYGAAALFFRKALQAMHSVNANAPSLKSSNSSGSGAAAGGEVGGGNAASRPSWRQPREEVSYSLGLQHLLQGR
jgi:hypothetical protein